MIAAADKTLRRAKRDRRRDQPLVGRRLIRLLEGPLPALPKSNEHGKRVLHMEYLLVA